MPEAPDTIPTLPRPINPPDTVQTPLTRRAALAVPAAVMLAAPALAAAHPDAALFRAIAAYAAASDAYNLRGGRNDPDEDALAEIEPKTMDGVRALARLAQRIATSHPAHDWSDAYVGDLPARVCQSLLRLFGDTAAVASAE